jgi:hypothetical protein
MAFLQYKGYPYHFYPPLASAMLLLGLLLVEPGGSGTGRSRMDRALCGGVLAVLMLQGTGDRIGERLYWGGPPEASNTEYGRMVRLAREHAKGDCIFSFSPAVAAAFPLVTSSGVGWASRHPCLWFLTSLYSQELAAKTPLSYHPIESMVATERFLFDTVVDDLVRERPALLFVDESEHKRAFHGQHFGYLDYYARDPRFADFLRQYESLTKVEMFRVYRRKGRRSDLADARGLTRAELRP